jgi:Uma2 family endonuclease
MLTAPAAPLSVSVDQYLRTDYEPNCEYLDGVLAPKPLPDRIHSKLQTLLAAWLLARTAQLPLEILTELHLRIGPTQWRVPDLSVLVAPPADMRYLDAESPPLLTIEIVSRDEPWPALRAKVTDHLAVGVSYVIVADPHSRTVMLASREEPLREIASPLLVNIPVPGAGVLQIDFDDLYSRL